MIQNIFRHVRNFFRKLKFRYKLSIYFTLFGLLIGYASFIMFMAIVTFKFVHIGMDFVNRWRTETVLPGDFIMGLSDKKFSTAVNSVSPAIGRLAMGFSRDPYVKDIYFYCYSPREKLWYRIYRDRDDVMKRGEIPENSETADAWKTLKRTIYLNSSIFYGRSDELNFWLNITRPADRNFYFMRIVSVRSGILDFLEGGHVALLYAAGVLFISVLLSRLILGEVYGTNPALISMPPRLRPMLEAADAALIIGDPALVIDPDELRGQHLHVTDLGEEWMRMTGLPMVFAVWAGRSDIHSRAHEEVFIDSCRFGLEHLDEIVDQEHAQRGISARLARQYLTENLVLELGETEYRGMSEFLRLASQLAPARTAPKPRPEGVTV